MSLDKKHRNISILLVIIFLVSALPTSRSAEAAQTLPQRTHNEAEALLYISDAILTPENELDTAAQPAKLFSETYSQNIKTDTSPLLARFIHGKKMQRNDLEANCKLLVDEYLSQGKECEAKSVREYCQAKKDEINIQIGFYHKMRGDRRKLFTRLWHSLKRTGANFWHRIGPLGRNILRNLGDESLQIVASGGTLSGATIKNLIKNQLRKLGRERIRQFVFQGVRKLLQGQIAIARASGIDLCADKEPGDQTEVPGEKSGTSNKLILTLSAPGTYFIWEALYQPTDPDHTCGSAGGSSGGHRLPDKFTITIDPEQQTLSGTYSGTQDIVWPPTGVVESEIHQEVSFDVSGPYEYLDSENDIYLELVGTADVNLSSSGWVSCQYWTVPATGDPIHNQYTVQNSSSKNAVVPVEISVYSEDRKSGWLTLSIVVPNWDINSHYSFLSEKITLSEEQIKLIWPD